MVIELWKKSLPNLIIIKMLYETRGLKNRKIFLGLFFSPQLQVFKSRGAGKFVYISMFSS